MPTQSNSTDSERFALQNARQETASFTDDNEFSDEEYTPDEEE